MYNIQIGNVDKPGGGILFYGFLWYNSNAAYGPHGVMGQETRGVKTLSVGGMIRHG